MIKEIKIKFGIKLKPTKNSCKLQLYKNYKQLTQYIHYITQTSKVQKNKAHQI